MFLNSIKMLLLEMLRKKTVVFTFFLVLAFVMANFYHNMFNNNEIQYISQMYDPIKMLTLSDWSVSGYFFMEYFPLLVVVPTSCAYLTDRDTKMKIYIESKTGKGYYWYAKLIVVFLTTFLIFTIPFFIEIMLSGICFDFHSAGDPSNFPYVQIIEYENQYFLSQLWLNHRVLYGIVMTCFFGIVSGVLAMFNFSITTLPFFKFKIFTFFPIYILFYIISFFTKLLNLDYTINYFFILRMFNLKEKNYIVYAVFLLILLIISFLLIKIKTVKDDLI